MTKFSIKLVPVLKRNKFFKESILYTTLNENKVECGTCWHQCLIKNNQFGRCQTRININGKLYCINYGLISSFSVNPIEKKPLFHYYPGTYASTVGSYSCNFSCPWCQNWSISKTNPNNICSPHYLKPNDLVNYTEKNSEISGISISFNEPTLSLEYALDVFQLCQPETYRMFVTNGYMTSQSLDLLIKSGLTGMSITIKGDLKTVKLYCKANVERVWDNIKTAFSNNLHIEVICLVIPDVNDSSVFFNQLSKRLCSISPNVPLHFTRFFPNYEFTKTDATSISTLEKAHQIAKNNGLNFVYLGNVPGHTLENTYCPECNNILIKRSGYQIEKKYDINAHACPDCGKLFPIFEK